MIKVETKLTFKAPNLNFQDDLLFIAERIVIPQLQKGIHNGFSVDGAPFPALEPSTIKRKQGVVVNRTFTKKGNIRSGIAEVVGSSGLRSLSARTLIETGALVASFFARKTGRNTVLVSMRPNRKEIGGFLQIDGVGKLKKKFNFFGVSTFMEQDALKYMRGRIKDAIRRAKG